MDGDTEDSDFGRDSLTFLNFIEGLRMSFLKEIWALLVYFHNYDGVISDEKFVPLYDEI